MPDTAIQKLAKIQRFKSADALHIFVEKQWPGVDLSLTDHNFNDETHLSMIEVPLDQRRGGVGSQIMRMVTDYADQNKRILTLSPEYCGRGGPSKEKLTAWYREFGFVPNKGRNKDYRFRALMIRRPYSIWANLEAPPRLTTSPLISAEPVGCLSPPQDAEPREWNPAGAR
jgi:hypothetical protein